MHLGGSYAAALRLTALHLPDGCSRLRGPVEADVGRAPVVGG